MLRLTGFMMKAIMTRRLHPSRLDPRRLDTTRSFDTTRRLDTRSRRLDMRRIDSRKFNTTRRLNLRRWRRLDKRRIDSRRLELFLMLTTNEPKAANFTGLPMAVSSRMVLKIGMQENLTTLVEMKIAWNIDMILGMTTIAMHSDISFVKA